MRAPSVTITEVGSNARDLLALRYEWHDVSATDTQFDERFHEWWRSERHHRRATVALTSEERPVGMANALIYSRMPSPGRPPARWLYAANVFLSPEFRRQGIASALMSERVEHARAEGMVRVVLAPSEMSKPLYRFLGFRVADDLMRLDLT